MIYNLLIADRAKLLTTTKKRKRQPAGGASSKSSTSRKLLTVEINGIIEKLKLEQHCDSTKQNYYAVLKLFNQFFIRLDAKPDRWEDRLTLFVDYLVHTKKQSSMVRSYISAIKAVLRMNNIKITEDQYVLASMVRACKLKNDQIQTRLLIQKGMPRILLNQVNQHFIGLNQPYLAILYQTIFSTMYFGWFRICEIVLGSHTVRAKDVHIGQNKKKLLFLLHT